MILKLKRTPGLYLVGFMGSGKSTIGRSLANEIGWSFFDTDAEIESEQGVSIAEIFDTAGEPAFRLLETDMIRRHVRRIERGKPTVLALGGGAFAQQENFELLENNGVTIWLDCPWEVVTARLADTSDRPLARDRRRLEALYHERRPVYARADYHVDASADDPQPIVSSILNLPLF